MIQYLHSTSREPYPKKIETPKQGSWVHVVEPTKAELEELSEKFSLDLDLLSDALDVYETPRVEQDNGKAYVFARYCFPQGKDIATEPLLIIYTKEQIFTIQRLKTNALDRLLDGVQPIATTQKTNAFVNILATINYSYDRNMHAVNKHILSLRSKLSKADIKNAYFVEFIDIEENLNEYLTALQPQAIMLRNLLGGRFLPLYEGDKDIIEDLSHSTTELIDLIKSRLKTISNIRDAYSTIMANNLNRIFKRLTSIGIFLAVPTVTASLYGMNVRLPNADSPVAFWEVLGIASLATIVFILLFKKLKWL